MRVHAVNIVEIVDGDLAQILSFSDDKRGNKAAEGVFVKMAEENGMPAEETATALEDGYWQCGTDGSRISYYVTISHS